MKLFSKVFIFCLLLSLLSNCADDLKIYNPLETEGNLIIRIASNGRSSTRAMGEEDDPANDSGDDNNSSFTEAINTDEYYVNPEDFTFYVFDNRDNCIRTFTKNDLTKAPELKSGNITEYSFYLGENDPFKSDIKVLALVNAQSFDSSVTYPDLTDKSLDEVYSVTGNLFSYPVTGDAPTWIPSQVLKQGIPMFGISESTSIQENYYNVEVPVIRALAKIEVEYEQDFEDLKREANSCTIYILNNSPWQQVYLYTWYGQEPNVTALCGGWPGMSPSGQTIIDGEIYNYYNIIISEDENITFQTQNLIFNNNNGLQIDGPQNVNLVKGGEYYYELKGTNGDSWTDVTWSVISSRYQHNGRTVYIKNETSWDQIYLYVYAYVDGTEQNDIRLTGPWPGKQPTGQEMIDGEIYYFFDLGDSNANNFQLIFNNGKYNQIGEFIGLQTKAYEIGALDANYFFRVTDNQTTNYRLDRDGFTVYIKKNTGWVDDNGEETMYIYMWGEQELCGVWPGMSPSGVTKINNEDYFYFHLPEEWSGMNENLIFNNGKHIYGSLDEELEGISYYINKDIYWNLKKEIANTHIEPKVGDTYKIYVENKTGWQNVRLYMYGDMGDDWGGDWPGIEPEERPIIKDGKEYLVFTLPGNPEDKEYSNENLIFNNNQGQQLNDYNFKFEGDLYLTIQNGYNYELTSNHYHNQPTIRINANNQWSNVNIYSWDPEYFNSWPGQSLNYNDSYYYCDFFKETSGNFNSTKLIIHNGDGDQIDNIGGEPYNFQSDIYGIINPSEVEAPSLLEELTIPDSGDRYIRGIVLSKYNDKGTLIPEITEEKNMSWNVENIGVDKPSVPTNVTENLNLNFVRNNNVWVAYVPEMILSEGERPVVNIDFKAFPSTIPFEVDYFYDKDTDKQTGPKNTLPSLLRNNIYHYKVKLDIDHLDIKYTVCPWIETNEVNIRFE